MSTARFFKSLTSVSANNIITLLDLPQELAYYEQFKVENIVDHSIILEDLQCKVGLFSLLEADWPDTNALASESAVEAARAKILKEGQKIYLEVYIAKGNGPWELQGEEILQNKNGLEQPWALMAPCFSTNETALLGEDLKIGVRVANKAQGVGGLKGSDYLRIFGTWRKQTKIESKKKDNGVEALNDRISALETLLSVYGAPSANLPGSNGLVPAPPAGSGEFLLRGDRNWENPSKFATPAQISSAILALVADAPDTLNTLGEIASHFGNYVSLTASQNIGGLKRFTATDEATNTTSGTRFDGGVGIAKNLWVGGSINQTINHSFKAAASASQPITNATFTKITLSSEITDTNNQYNPTLSRLTAITTEVWRIGLFITFNLAANSRILLSVYKNGAESNGVRVLDNPTNSGFFGQSIIIPEITLAANDYLEVFCYISPGQSVYGDATLGATYWYGKRIN